MSSVVFETEVLASALVGPALALFLEMLVPAGHAASLARGDELFHMDNTAGFIINVKPSTNIAAKCLFHILAGVTERGPAFDFFGVTMGVQSLYGKGGILCDKVGDWFDYQLATHPYGKYRHSEQFGGQILVVFGKSFNGLHNNNDEGFIIKVKPQSNKPARRFQQPR